MPTITIYHNPRCSKSRQTLALLEERGVSPAVVEYLSDPPSKATLKRIVKMLGVRPIDLVRRREEPFKTLGLVSKQDDDEAILNAMARHPILIERPIVIKGDKAALGRPPENVLEIL